MKRNIKSTFILLILSFSAFILQGQEIILKQTNKSGIYAKGEKINVKVYAGNQIGDTLRINVYKNNKQSLGQTVLLPGCDTLSAFEGSFDDPCSIIVVANTKIRSVSLGMLVDPEKLVPGAKCPPDFNAYWDNIKETLNKLPVNIHKTAVEGPDVEKGYLCENLEINCPGPKPVRGYFARPENAAVKSLPIVLLVHAAGVKGSWCRSEPENAMKYARKGALCFDLNAHGMLNGQPESYYSELESGELKTYWLQGITNREEIYFRGMYLRLLRTIDFLTSMPEWDGKRILVIGESQGGGQALIAAGLDPRVSAVVAIVPAMCDWFGPLAGRMGGWPQPYESDASKEDMQKALPYFDAANILKNSKAIIYTEIGLIDMVCPSTSVYAAINQAPGQKIIYTVPYRPHHQPEGDLAKIWEETVYKPRELFIQNYLK
jgi:cephalosporin-C deacetylase